MNILASLNPITRRALRINYKSPFICALADDSSGSGSSTVDVIGMDPTYRVAGPELALALNGSGVEMSWTGVANAYAYIVYRAAAVDGPYTAIISGLITREYVDAPGSGQFFYKVTAIEPNFGESEASNIEEVTV